MSTFTFLVAPPLGRHLAGQSTPLRSKLGLVVEAKCSDRILPAGHSGDWRPNLALRANVLYDRQVPRFTPPGPLCPLSAAWDVHRKTVQANLME